MLPPRQVLMVVFFGPHEPRYRKAVRVFREFPNASDEVILDKLVAMGCERVMAARLVEFVPMTYCRLRLADSDVRFSDRFQRRLADGTCCQSGC